MFASSSDFYPLINPVVPGLDRRTGTTGLINRKKSDEEANNNSRYAMPSGSDGVHSGSIVVHIGSIAVHSGSDAGYMLNFLSH